MVFSWASNSLTLVFTNWEFANTLILFVDTSTARVRSIVRAISLFSIGYHKSKPWGHFVFYTLRANKFQPTALVFPHRWPNHEHCSSLVLSYLIRLVNFDMKSYNAYTSFPFAYSKLGWIHLTQLPKATSCLPHLGVATLALASNPSSYEWHDLESMLLIFDHHDLCKC